MVIRILLYWRPFFRIPLTLTRFVTAFETATTGLSRSGISWPASPSSWMITRRATCEEAKKCHFAATEQTEQHAKNANFPRSFIIPMVEEGVAHAYPS